jgi:hypothetical protein
VAESKEFAPSALEFGDFKRSLVGIVDSRHFGDQPGDRAEGNSSPAYREIRKKQFQHFRGERFHRKLFAIAKEFQRLALARLQVPSVAKAVSPLVAVNHNAKRALSKIAIELRQRFVPKYVPETGDPLRARVWAVSEELEDIAFEFQQRAKRQSDKIHVKLRTRTQISTGWKPLLSDYDLTEITGNAPRKWFYKTADDAIRNSRNGANLTEMTRMKLVAAAFKAATGREVQPTAIKESLRAALTCKENSVRQ